MIGDLRGACPAIEISRLRISDAFSTSTPAPGHGNVWMHAAPVGTTPGHPLIANPIRDVDPPETGGHAAAGHTLVTPAVAGHGVNESTLRP